MLKLIDILTVVWFSKLMQRIFKYDAVQNTYLTSTSDEELCDMLNTFLHCIQELQTLKNGPFWSTLYI